MLELEKRGIDFFRLNAEDLTSSTVRYFPASGKNKFNLRICGRELSLSRINAAYFRRPGRPVASTNIESGHREYCESEWISLLKSLSSVLHYQWLNSPQAIDAAENKPLQIFLAAQMGFNIPETIVTNDVASAQELLDSGKTIAKPLRNALVKTGDQESVIFTTSVNAIDQRSISSIHAAPIIFQRQIEKEFDVRVTVVGNNVFAVAIYSQENVDTMVDWRNGENLTLKHLAIDLPDDVRELCIGLVNRLHLRFGAIDLIKDRRGKYWFLEINPNGQWAWIENRTGAPIASAIVDELIRIATT